MKRYILIRLIKSIVSICIVVAIVVAIVYKLIPISKVFEGDMAFQKLKGNQKIVYQYSKLQELGYLKYYSIGEMCKLKSTNNDDCIKNGSEEQKRVLDEFVKDGYEIKVLDQGGGLDGSMFAYKLYNVPQLIGHFLSRLVVVDHPWKIEDPKNSDLKRSYAIQRDQNGVPALTCSGCNYKYQLYFNSKFPFIHQNILNLNFGESFPTHAGVHTLDVISREQGKAKKFHQKFPTGLEADSAILQHTLQYKYEPDHLDKKRYEDNYAKAENKGESPSMIGTSYLFGIFALIFEYLVAVPAAVSMARNKGKFADKLGIVYINVLIAIPSLAFIFFMKYLGFLVGLPDKFPQLGFGDVRSYILPVVILGLLGTPSLMTWIRRYMVDQSNADYVKFAKAKGLTKREISRNHIFKNAIIPIVNGIPAALILAIGGAVITESIFAIPGMGKMLPDAITQHNNNMVVTLTFIFTTLSIFAIFLGDLLMTLVDPRISLDVKKGD